MTILQLTQAAAPVTSNLQQLEADRWFRSKQAPTAEGLERLPTKREIAGSSLVAAMHFFFSTKPIKT